MPDHARLDSFTFDVRDGRRERSRPIVRLAALSVVAAFLAAVAISWTIADRQLRERRLDDAVTQAALLRDGELRAVEQWAQLQIDDAVYWAENDDVLDAVRGLMSSDDPLTDPAQAALRNRLAPFLDLSGLAGYFVVRADGISLASTRDENVGTENLVAVDHPDILADILSGTARLAPPQLSDVPLTDDGSLSETMFVGAPIRVAGEVVGAFLLRLVPSSDLTALLEDSSPDDGIDHLVFGESGVAVTAARDIAPLDPVTADGRPTSALFERDERGVNVAAGSASPPDRIEAWATSSRLGLGVLTTYDGSAAFESLRAERRWYATFALLAAVVGIGLAAFAHQLAARSRMRQIEASERRFRSLVDPSPDPVLRVHPDGSVIAANPALYSMLGLPAPDPSRSSRTGEASGLTIDALSELHPALAELAERWPIIAKIQGPADIERLAVELAGQPTRYFRVRVAPIIAGRDESEILVVLTDTTPDVERELRLESLALVDTLTGLPNRAAISDRLEVALARLRRPAAEQGVAVMVIDLDHFKTINDAFGHAAGDHVLRTVGAALDSELRDADSVGRIGGDEFTIVCGEVADIDAADDMARRVSERLNTLSVELDGSTISVSGSIGVAWTREPIEPADLMMRADRAMLDAKRRRDDGYVVAGPGDASPSGWSTIVPRDLFGALDRGEFELHYQPIVDATGRIRSAEALLRWNHPEHGLMTPGHFLSTLMESGFIGPVGRWGVTEAVAQAARWSSDGTPIPVHVNVSPVELSAGVIDAVAAAIEHTGIDPRLVCVEVTEHAFNGNMLTAGSIERLGRLGVDVALDDFGTGSSSLINLRQRPLHMLKLDRSFVASIDADSPRGEIDRPILRSIIRLAHELELELVAEGVETEEQIRWLVDAGCGTFQGWAFARAMPARELDPTATLTPVEVES